MGLLSLGAWWRDQKRQEMLWFGSFASIQGWGSYDYGLLLEVSTRPFNHLENPLAQLATTQLTAAFFGEFALSALRVRAKGWWRLLFFFRPLACLGWRLAGAERAPGVGKTGCCEGLWHWPRRPWHLIRRIFLVAN